MFVILKDRTSEWGGPPDGTTEVLRGTPTVIGDNSVVQLTNSVELRMTGADYCVLEKTVHT